MAEGKRFVRTFCALAIPLIVICFLAWLLKPDEPTVSVVDVEALARAPSVGLELRQVIQANQLAADANRFSYTQTLIALLGVFTGLATLSAAIVAAIYARLAAEEARRSASAAERALLAERAWLSARPIAVGPLRFDMQSDLSIEVGIEIENVGHTPALFVHTRVDMINAVGDIAAAVKNLAAEELKKGLGIEYGRLLLPGDSYLRPWVASIGDPDSEPFLMPVIIGCVTYQTTLDDRLHQTTFSAFVGAKNQSLLERGVNVSPDQVEVTPTVGTYAD